MGTRGRKPGSGRQRSEAEKAALEEAIALAGGPAKLARHASVGVSPQVVQGWRRNGLPRDRAQAVEAATGVSVFRLRPDVRFWPVAVDRASAP